EGATVGRGRNSATAITSTTAPASRVHRLSPITPPDPLGTVVRKAGVTASTPATAVLARDLQELVPRSTDGGVKRSSLANGMLPTHTIASTRTKTGIRLSHQAGLGACGRPGTKKNSAAMPTTATTCQR